MRAFIYVLIGLLLLTPALASAQTFQGGIRGTVTDQDGGVLPGTTVTLTNVETGVARTSVTNARGEYVFASVAPGTYDVTASLTGFAPYTREALEIGVASQLVQDITLNVGGIAESVTVTGETPLIETANASIASAIDKAQLEVLPTPGRNLFIMSVTTPNVVHTGDPVFVRQQDQTNSSLLSLGGGPLRGNLYTMDGVAMTDMRNRAVIIPNFEGTEEMKVQINTYDAEMGRTGGAVFNTIHKSGTNNWAGSGLYQSRPNFGRSKTLFEDEKAADAPYDLWGGGFGGPIVRDKAFFYFSTEGYVNTDLRNDVMVFPTRAMAEGDFSAFGRQIFNPFATDGAGNRQPFPNNQIPANMIDPAGQNLARLLADVGAAGGCPQAQATPCEVGATAALDNIAYQWTANINTSLTDDWQLSGTWMFYDSEEPANKYYEDILGEVPAFDTGGASLFRRAYVLAINSTHVIGDSDVLTLRYGWTYFDDSVSNPPFGPSDARGLGFTGDFLDQVTLEQFPDIDADGYGDNDSTHGSWSSNDIQWWSQEISGTYSKFVGSHTLKYGAQWRRIGLDANSFRNGFQFDFDQAFTQGPDPRAPALASGDSIASMLLGLPESGNATIPTEANVFVDYFGGFVQDDWRLNDDLVLNLGLRVEYETGLNEENDAFITEFSRSDPFPVQVGTPPGLAGAPGFPLVGGPLYPGQQGAPSVQWADSEQIKLGPRAGFAYSVDEDTVIRGGFGLYWAPYTIPTGTSATGLGTTGFTAISNYQSSTDGVTPLAQPGGGVGSLSNPYPNGISQPVGSALGQLTNAGEELFFNDQFKEASYLSKWSVDYQRNLTSALVFKAGYVGSKGSNLGIGGTNNSTVNINQLDPSFLNLGAALDEQLANPFFGNAAFGPLSQQRTLPRGQLLRPFPQFTDVFARHSSLGRSRYDALRLELEKRFRGNWGARINYTYANQRDNVYESNTLLENEESTVFLNNRVEDGDFGDSRIESEHWLNLNGLYRFPNPDGGAAEIIAGGWSVSVTALLRSGFPLTITQDTNNLGSEFGFDHQRPNLTGADPVGAGDTGGISHGDPPPQVTGLINPAAFENAPAFTPGNTPHTLPDVRSPKLVNWDVSFEKQTPLGGSANLLLRFEFINIFNGINWRGPQSIFGQTDFGQITGVRGFPRTMQFMAKVTF